MANKIVAVFLMCIVLAAAISVEARIFPDVPATYRIPEKQQFRSCFVNCHKECPRLQGQYTDCEMKCDSECSAKEFAAKLRI